MVETILFIVVIILLLVIMYLMYCIGKGQNKIDFYHQQWDKWENRWYEAQLIVSTELAYHITPSGLKGETKLTKHESGED